VKGQCARQRRACHAGSKTDEARATAPWRRCGYAFAIGQVQQVIL